MVAGGQSSWSAAVGHLLCCLPPSLSKVRLTFVFSLLTRPEGDIIGSSLKVNMWILVIFKQVSKSLISLAEPPQRINYLIFSQWSWSLWKNLSMKNHPDFNSYWICLAEMDERQVSIDMVTIWSLLNIRLLRGCKGKRWSTVLASHKCHIVALLHGHKVATLCPKAGPGLRTQSWTLACSLLHQMFHWSSDSPVARWRR